MGCRFLINVSFICKLRNSLQVNFLFLLVELALVEEGVEVIGYKKVFNNLNDVPAYYSYYEHYAATTRNMDRKPSFKSFLKELEGHSMKEIGEKFTEDKMKEIKLRESIRTEVRNKINELFKIK